LPTEPPGRPILHFILQGSLPRSVIVLFLSRLYRYSFTVRQMASSTTESLHVGGIQGSPVHHDKQEVAGRNVELQKRGNSAAVGFSPLYHDDEDTGEDAPSVEGRGRGGWRHSRLESEWERSARRNQRMLLWAVVAIAVLVAILVSLMAVAIYRGINVGGNGGPISSRGGNRGRNIEVSKIAFGSCTTFSALEEQPIWTQGIVPAEPDAWIWLGDMAYLDLPTVDCFHVPNDPECSCRDNYMRVEPTCAAGYPANALRRYDTILQNPEYNAFLDFMCPAAREEGLFPPPGLNKAICPRAIMGTYDDHDSGWNNGDARNEQKWVYKNMFLDAVGEDPDSPRRNAHQGIWHKYVLNEGTDREIEVFLLDERYDRAVKPCYLRQEYCEKVLDAMDRGENTTTRTAWCEDFLRGGHGGNGSCCAHDEQIYFGWCLEPSSRDSPYWEEACDTSSKDFGKRWLVYDDAMGDVREPDGTEEVDSQDSPFCEVLGREQRAWLQRELDQSTASLRLIVSGSVVLGKPGEDAWKYEDETIQCSWDDWDCFRVAQQNLLSQLSKAPGCSVILTGDYHYGDIKALQPGPDTSYADWYASQDYKYPIYQVMSSGMTVSTAEENRMCEGPYVDEAGLRPYDECSMVLDPNF
ncbi:unnamed protein product, partial [Ascophyllum nodosum]